MKTISGNKKSKSAIAVVLCVMLALIACFACVACDGDAKKTERTVTFDANGGTLTGSATVKVEDGGKITNAPTAAKEGYDFEAWYTQATGGDKIALDAFVVSQDMTVYAHYTEKAPAPSEKAKVTFDANGGTISGEKVIEVDDDGLIMDVPTATREGYRFDAWYTKAEGGDVVDPMFDETTENITLYAQWIKTYVVTFDAGEGTLTGSATLTIDENGKVAGAPTAAKPGDEFHGWYTAATGGDKVDFATYTVSSNVTLYAHFGVITMPIKTLKDTDGTSVGYRIEAEEAKIVGELNSENQAGTGFIENNQATASGSTSVGYLGVVGNTVTFTFKSAEAGKANIALRASSGNMTFDFTAGFAIIVNDQVVTTSDYTVAFNGNAINYKPATLRGAGPEHPNVFNMYWDEIDFGELDVVAGMNSLVITVASTAAPNLDCLDIQTSLVLSSANGDAASGEASLPEPPPAQVAYEKDVAVKLLVGGYAGGPAVDKAVLTFTEDIPAEAVATSNPFAVNLGGKIGGNAGDKVYLCDADGNPLAATATASRYVAIDYKVSYGQWNANNNLNPFSYNQTTGRNTWKDIATTALTISGLKIGETTYTSFGGAVTATKEVPCIEGWDVSGTYTKDEITLKYASFAPAANAQKTGKKPLIVWLHGAGEGGTDPTITLLGNQVSNLSKDLIQNYFVTDSVSGAYVLAPQAPTMWMDNGSGTQGGADVGESIYTEALFALIQNYVTTNADIDANRVYIGGCSNGGWMTVEMLSKHGEFFAAAFPIAVPFDKTAGITDEEFARLVNVPMWITHAKADRTVEIGSWTTSANWWEPATFNAFTEVNSNSLYIELLAAGATDVHYSLFDTVTLTEGDEAATYDGHYSWIYALRDDCANVQAKVGTGDGNAFTVSDINLESAEVVKLSADGEGVGLWAWIAAQAKTTA